MCTSSIEKKNINVKTEKPDILLTVLYDCEFLSQIQLVTEGGGQGGELTVNTLFAQILPGAGLAQTV
jgi:hypothetical protein